MKGILTFFLLAFGIAAHGAQKTVTLPVHTVSIISNDEARSYPGRVVPTQKVDIVPQVSGEIMEVLFREGDIVKEGDVLYRIDKVKYEAAVLNAKAEVEERKAKFSYAKAAYIRHQKLDELKAVSKDETENALSNMNSAEAALEAAKANLLVAENDLKHCEIVAPIDGRLGSNKITKGNYVTPNSGVLATLVQAVPIKVRFALANSDYLKVFAGHFSEIKEKGLVKITLADGSPYAEEGKIIYVENVSDEMTDTIFVYVQFENISRILKPYGVVGVELSRKGGIPSCAVPPASIMQDIEGTYVWVLDKDNAVSRRPIIRGRMIGDLQVVEAGLEAGERVVAEGVHKVAAGDVVAEASK